MAGKGKRVQKGRDLQEHPEALPASGRTFLFSFNLPVITKADIRVFLVTGCDFRRAIKTICSST